LVWLKIFCSYLDSGYKFYISGSFQLLPKALDNRYGFALVLELLILSNLAGSDLPDLVAVETTLMHISQA
jgi:putative aminopeptidase FrvX